jgi:hypothetical protein
MTPQTGTKGAPAYITWGVALVGYGIVNLGLFDYRPGFIHPMTFLQESIGRVGGVGRDREDGHARIQSY